MGAVAEEIAPHLKPGATVIDVGTNVIDDATRRLAAASRHVARCKDALEKQP